MRPPQQERGEAAVSPVLAVIMMVAITVVLSAALYGFTSAFGGESEAVFAGFALKPVDLPSPIAGTAPAGDADGSPDVLEVTFTRGAIDLLWEDVLMTFDGLPLQQGAAGANAFRDSGTTLCTSLPGGRTTGTEWRRGDSIYLWKANGASCGVAAANPGLVGTHLLEVAVRNQLVVSARLEVRDSLA